MGLIGKIFGTDKAITETSRTVNNIFDKISSGIGLSVFTDQEKSVAKFENQKLQFETLKLIVSTSNGGDALARRVIAFIIMGFYFSSLTFIGGLKCFGYTVLSTELFNLITTEPPGYVTTVLFIYFGYYGVKSSIKAYKK